ncbi:MAG: isoprenylcysteine carboxylmethyltransferase family protein [Thermoplasmata archaeon]
MLGLLVVQISAGIALVATSVGFTSGISRTLRSGQSVGVVISRTPAQGTQLAWIVGTLVALFWPAGVFLVPMYAYHWPAFPDFQYSWIVQIAGVVLGVAGGLIYSRSARALGAQMTPRIQIRKGAHLVQTGPYRYVRHPVYGAIIVIALGQTFLFLSSLAAVLTVLLVCLALYRARLEEGLLGSSDGFGSIYRSYVTHTGRFVPRFRAAR